MCCHPVRFLFWTACFEAVLADRHPKGSAEMLGKVLPNQSAPDLQNVFVGINSHGEPEESALTELLGTEGDESEYAKPDNNAYGMQYGTHVQAIIIDLSSGVLRAGFAGDEYPRCVFTAIVGTPKYPNIVVGTPPAHTDGTDAAELHHPLKHGIVNNWASMQKVWQHAFQQLGVDPSQYNVLLTESALSPMMHREKASKIMLEHFKAKGVYFGMQAILSLYARGSPTGVVVEIDDGVIHIVPVVEGYAMSHAIIRLDIGGRDLTQFLTRLLTEIPENQGRQFLTSMDLEIARDIKEKLAYVSADYDKELKNDESKYHERYPMPDGQSILVGTARFRCVEPLFQPKLLGVEEEGIHALIVRAVSMCDVHTRRKLYRNVVLSGASTMFPGLKERLQKEVEALVPGEISVRIIADPYRDFFAWRGGSIMTDLDLFDGKWYTKAKPGRLGVQEAGTALLM